MFILYSERDTDSFPMNIYNLRMHAAEIKQNVKMTAKLGFQ